MSNHFTAVKPLTKSPGAKVQGRSFVISMKGIPKVDAKAKARLEAAARNQNTKKRHFPTLALEA